MPFASPRGQHKLQLWTPLEYTFASRLRSTGQAPSAPRHFYQPPHMRIRVPTMHRGCEEEPPAPFHTPLWLSCIWIFGRRPSIGYGAATNSLGPSLVSSPPALSLGHNAEQSRIRVP